MDASIKSCSVMYEQQCDEMLVPGPQQNSTMEAPNSITLVVDSETFSCYLVSAGNDSFSIIVEVRTSMGTGKFATRKFVQCQICNNSYDVALALLQVML